ncbi:MAG TPA: FCD domain-containing protein [Euzebyales bacterium]
MAELSALMHEARRHPDGDDELHRDRWSSLNHEFHQRMYAATGRTHTVRVVLQVMDLVEPYSRMYVHLLGGVELASDEHDAMVDALRDRDPETLAGRVRDHLEHARRELLDERWWNEGQFDVPPAGAGAAPTTGGEG